MIFLDGKCVKRLIFLDRNQCLQRGIGLKGKLLSLLTLSLFVLFVLSVSLLAKAQTEPIWSDNMNYQSLSQMQTAGWTTSNPVGVNFTSSGVVVDDYHSDTSIFYNGHFASGIVDWKVEDQNRWISGTHSGNSVAANTNATSYEFAADGWYSNFAFYAGGSKVWFSAAGTYSESQGALITLTMEKSGDQIKCYYNGQLKYTYTEKTYASSPLVGVSTVSPYLGAAEYDYFQLSTDSGSSSSSPGSGSSSVLSNPVAVGGIAGGVAVGVGAGVGLAIHFGVIGGGAAGSASAGSGAAATGSAGGASGSGAGASGSSGTGSSGGSGGDSGAASSQGGGGSGGGDAGDSNLVADAGNIQQMQDANAAAQQATTLQNQMQQANQAQADQRQKIQQDTQTKIMDTQQDVTQNKQKTQDKANQNADSYIRASTDSDSSVAQDGSGSAESGEG